MKNRIYFLGLCSLYIIKGVKNESLKSHKQDSFKTKLRGDERKASTKHFPWPVDTLSFSFS